MAMVGGLHETTSNLAASFDQGPVLVYTDGDLANSRIEGGLLPTNGTSFIAFCFADVTLKDFNARSLEHVYAVSIYDPDDILGLNITNESVDSGVWMGTQLADILASHSINYAVNTTYILDQGENMTMVHLTALYSEGSIMPDDWIIIPRSSMDVLRPDLAGDYSFLMIVDSETPIEEQPFYTGTVKTSPTIGIIGFFEQGIYQVEQGLWGIILMSGSMTAILVYCIISIETEYSAPTIKILRGIGAKREYVVRVFLLKALFITLVGGIVGTAMGFCAANAISSMSSMLDVMTFITPVADFRSVVLPFLISMISGLIGGFWPALRASRMFAPRGKAQ
jgi:hypothetical protein